MAIPTAVSSGNKAPLFNDENEALYDPNPWFMANNVCPQIPWPEWSDSDLNAELWDEGKTSKNSTAAKNASSLAPVATPLFQDPDPPKPPPSILHLVHSWKRPEEVFQNVPLILYDTSNVVFQLHPSDASSSVFGLFQTFCDLLPVLQIYALKHGFAVELETPSFFANTQGEPWRPWHHIYALCKAGKGQTHKPSYCPYGKYVVRLFYMGAWRRFVVDDTIPCDRSGSCMLPTTQINGELWPIILMKALMKIFNLTPAYDFTATDFPFLSFFTGWSKLTFSTSNKTSEQIWRRLAALSPNYTQRDAESVAISNKNLPKKESSKKDSERIAEGAEKFCFLLGALHGSSGDSFYTEYAVSVTMTRNNPSLDAAKRQGTKPWKKIRWVHWAKEKGLWRDESHLPPFRRLLIISLSTDIHEMLAPDPQGAPCDVSIDGADSKEELTNTDPEQWCDYYKFLNYLLYMEVFFKPSYFTQNLKISCIKGKTNDNVSTAKSTAKAPVIQTLFLYPFLLKQTCNEPVYIMCESLTGIFLYFSLWVCPQTKKNCEGYLESELPRVLKIAHATLIIENCSWTTIEQGEVIGVVKTVGFSSLALHLKPGRNVLKLWLYSDSPYVIDVYSNANFVIEKTPKLRYLMSAESQQIITYVTNVSNAFINLTQKFGKPDLASCLRDFYDIIKPGHEGVLHYHKYLDDFIEIFLNSILYTLKDLIANVDEVKIMMWALRSLFINPKINCDLPPGRPASSMYAGGGGGKKTVKKVVTVRERTLSEILNYLWSSDEINKIITIQRIFRGYRVRLLFKYQSPNRKEFKIFTERLKKICDAIFAPPKREVEVGKLIRRIVIQKPELFTFFRFYKDFLNVVQVEEFSGRVVNVEPFAWIPIARFMIACHCDGLVPCAFYLSCNLEQFVVQGFNNDTGKEIFRLTNTVSPNYYQTNEKGYTIFVFGWNEANYKTVNWRLEMVKMKHFQVLHLCNALINSECHPYAMPSLDIVEIRNFYIPNSKSRICRCLIKITKRSLLTLRLSTSNPDVEFGVVIFLDKKFCEADSETETFGKVLANVRSTNGAVVIPSLVLEHVEINWWGEGYIDDSTIYILEAFVLNESWPLTKQEWGLVEPFRVNGENSVTNLPSKRGTESRKKLTRTSKKNINEQKSENPYWLIQVINDAPGPDSNYPIVIEEDKSYAESIKAMKLLWEEKDPGRRQRGRDLRVEFIYTCYLNERKFFCIAEDYEEEGEREFSIEEAQVILDRLSSFSYLLNDTSLTRYIYSPRTLPSTPLCELYTKYRIQFALDRSEVNLSQSCDSSFCLNSNELKVENQILEAEEDRKDFLKQCQHFRSIMGMYLDEEQKLSSKLMEEAYEGRSKAIERMMT